MPMARLTRTKEGVIMKVRFCKNPLLFLMIAVLFLSGCATELPKQTRRYVWPRPPDEPKIEWIKAYYSQLDFPKSEFQSTLELLFGAPQAISFGKPIDIKADGKGLVYITDIVRKAIYVYDLNAATVTVWKKSQGGEKPLAITPFYLSLDHEGNVYVVGAGATQIFVLDRAGVVSRTIEFGDKIKLNESGGIAVDSARGRIYLVDSIGAKIEVFALAGNHLFSFGKPGEGDGEMNSPMPISLNHKGEIVVGDVRNARIQIFDAEGKFLRKFGERGDAQHQLQVLKGLAVDSDDNVYITDGKASQLKIFDTNGQYLLTIGAPHSVPETRVEAPGGFLLPQGISIDSSDTIYIADSANMRFQVFKYLKNNAQSGSATTLPGGK